MKLLVTGLTGLIGSRFKELLGNDYEFDQINTSTGGDILNKDSVSDKISSSKANLVLHFAAKSNVDGCEIDKQRDKQILNFISKEEKEKAWVNEKTAWALNVFGTENVVNACKKTNKKIIYVSTDFVRAILEKLYKHENLEMITDHIMTPTFIDDLVNALDILIRTGQFGIFHVVGSQPITPYDASVKIAKEFDLDDSVISKTTRSEYFKGKAIRPFCLNLKNDKIVKLGIEMSSFDKGVKEIKNQMERIHL